MDAIIFTKFCWYAENNIIIQYSIKIRMPTYNEAMKVDQKPSFIMIFTYKMAPVFYERQSDRKQVSNRTEHVGPIWRV